MNDTKKADDKNEEQPISRLTVYHKIAEVCRAVQYIQKDGRNDFHGYNYLSEASVKAHVTKAVVQAGLSYGGTQIEILESYDVKTKNQQISRAFVVKASITITDPDGLGAVTFEGLGCGLDSADKGPMKAMTAAIKTALTHGLGIASGDDPEADRKTDEACESEQQQRQQQQRQQPPRQQPPRQQPPRQQPPQQSGRPRQQQSGQQVDQVPAEWAPTFGHKKDVPLREWTRKEGHSLYQWYEKKIAAAPSSRYRSEWDHGMDMITRHFKASDDAAAEYITPSREELRDEGAPSQTEERDIGSEPADDQLPF